ncbi:MAG: hypothetical protein JOZ22_10065, partial [Acidobacteriia bacterium]|nr:hypothetical protein [Terriglobia bacterium]
RGLAYFVGSGAAARSYLLNIDGFLYEAPVAFYSNADSWNAAPSYAAIAYPYLTRPVQTGCLSCHASGIQPVPGTQNAYRSPPFREGGVACERCHGPGSDHVANGKPMVNPAKLPVPNETASASSAIFPEKSAYPSPVKTRGISLRETVWRMT